MITKRLLKRQQNENKVETNLNDELNTDNEIDENNLDNIIKVETRISSAEKIDQLIVLQGQTVYNKKIDVRSETIGNITNIIG